MNKIKYLVITIILFSPLTSNSERKEFMNWGYITHYSSLSENYLKRKIQELDVISITGFSILQNGSIKEIKNKLLKNVLEISKDKGVLVYPLVNINSISSGIKILNSKKLTDKVIRNLEKIIKKYNFKGIHLDIEYLPANYNIKLGIFLKKIKEKLKNIELTMAIFPQVDFNRKTSMFHNLKAISPYLDEVVIMCYDYHNSKTDAGPVTDINWAEKNILYFFKYFKAKQIWLGIPSYGYNWKEDGKAKAISSKYGVKLSKKYLSKRDSSENLLIQFKSKGKKNTIFISDKTTRKELIELTRRYNLKGYAVWRLGLED